MRNMQQSWCRKAISFYIDSGTTTSLMVDYLGDRNITIVSSSLQVIADANKINANVLVLGGEINKTIGSVSGPDYRSAIGRYLFRQGFYRRQRL